MNDVFPISTDTATLSVFDLDAIKHRVSDTADWWSLPEDEIKEINNGNIIFIGLTNDGIYKIDVTKHIDKPDITLFIKVTSGTVFIGAGEDTSGGDLEPDNSDAISGKLFPLPINNYAVSFKKDGDVIHVSFKPSKSYLNNLEASVRI